MNVNDLVAHFGSQAKAARRLGVGKAAVSNWRTRGIPYPTQAVIQIKTRGRLRATLKEPLHDQAKAHPEAEPVA